MENINQLPKLVICNYLQEARQFAALFLFARPKSALELHMIFSPKPPNFNKFQISNARQIGVVYDCLCLNETKFCVCLWEYNERNNKAVIIFHTYVKSLFF